LATAIRRPTTTQYPLHANCSHSISTELAIPARIVEFTSELDAASVWISTIVILPELLESEATIVQI
jgi:hypothetical protein